MRSGRSFLALLVIALGLGAYIYFVEAPKNPDAADAKAKVFPESTAVISEVRIHASSGQSTTVTRDGSSWKITAPAALPADTAQVASLVSTLESLEIEKVIEDNPAAVAPFGLDPPRFTIAFTREGDATLHQLDVGNKNPTGADLYARVDGEPKLFLIGGYLESSLDRSTFDLRDKTALAFDRDAADALTLVATGVPERDLRRTDTGWRLTAPVQARADDSAVDSLMGRFAQLQMKSVVAEDGTADLKTYGLDTPEATVTVGAGSARAELALGKTLEDGTTVYARDLSRPQVFTVEASIVEDVKRNTDALRAKDLFAFRSFNAVGLDLTWNGQTASFVKKAPPATGDASPGPEVWSRTAPGAGDVDQTKMNDMLSSLSALRAESFTDKPLTTGDQLVVVARYGDAASPTEERMTFRKSGEAVQAIIPGEPGAALVGAASFDSIVSAIKELAGFK
ncbi:MAG: DUF4340 domain-containing protein [Vicinamibacterales bacterium]